MPTQQPDLPLVSVIMGVRYRRPDLSLLENAVASILCQTHSNLEFLICQNDSTPQAVARLIQFQQEDERVKLVDGTGADTLAEKLNRCIVHARGDYIARQDDDDESLPERLAQQLAYLQANPQVAFVGCNVQLRRTGQPVGERILPPDPQVKDFMFVQPFIHPTLMFQRQALKQVDGYCEASFCDGCEDYDLLLRMYEAGYKGANLQQIYFCYTIPPKGTTNRTFHLRVNEMKTRWRRFRSLHLLPAALPYVIKPVVVGLIPVSLLEVIKEKTGRRGN